MSRSYAARALARLGRTFDHPATWLVLYALTFTGAVTSAWDRNLPAAVIFAAAAQLNLGFALVQLTAALRKRYGIDDGELRTWHIWASEPEGVDQVIDKDGDTWTRTPAGWVMTRDRELAARISVARLGRQWSHLVARYAPLREVR